MAKFRKNSLNNKEEDQLKASVAYGCVEQCNKKPFIIDNFINYYTIWWAVEAAGGVVFKPAVKRVRRVRSTHPSFGSPSEAPSKSRQAAKEHILFMNGIVVRPPSSCLLVVV